MDAMGKEETLLKIKVAEAEVHAMREVSERDRERILRDARSEALELRDTLRQRAEVQYREILAEAEASVRAERERILSQGRAEADRIRSGGRANIERAIDLVLEKFRGALNA